MRSALNGHYPAICRPGTGRFCRAIIAGGGFRTAGVFLFVSIACIVASCAQDGAPEEAADESDLASQGESKLTAVSAAEDVLASGLVGSSHDFTLGGGEPLDLCTPCHTPHISAGRAPLLDKRPQVYRGVRPYHAKGVELDDSSLLCLSCHDGIVARDVYSYAHAVRGPGKLGGSWIGTGSLTSHPIGVEYPAVEATYHPAAAVTSSGRIKLPGGRVQCISCHDPHNSHRISGMLVDRNEGSRLCLSCHRL